jgi:hypothetical protein
LEPAAVLDTRAMPRGDEIVTWWKVQWQNLTADQATWEDKHFIKLTFPEFYRKTIQEWWPDNNSCGQERAQGGGGGKIVRNRRWAGVIGANLMRTRLIDSEWSIEEDIISKEMDDRSSRVIAFYYLLNSIITRG